MVLLEWNHLKRTAEGDAHTEGDRGARGDAHIDGYAITAAARD
jgi:hypothetical protein